MTCIPLFLGANVNDIHPSAIVEYSTLGEGVTIGAGAQVRFSTIGAASRRLLLTARDEVTRWMA